MTQSDTLGSQLGSRMMTAVQLAEVIPLSPGELVKAAERGELPCTWWGKQPLFDEDDIDRWLAENYREQNRVTLDDMPAWSPAPPSLAVAPDPPVPYQRSDGRWSVRLACPDGKVRRFVSRAKEAPQSEYRRSATRPGLSAHRRFTVLRRDDFTCRYCGRKPPDVQLEIDHRIPFADGGGDSLDNLVTACSECNSGKGRRESQTAY